VFQDRSTKHFGKSVSVIVISLASAQGCSSLSSPRSWFSNKTAAESKPLTSSIADTSKGFSAQLKSVGTTVSSAAGKAKTAITSTFSSKPAETMDPETSLSNMPEKLGAEIWVANGQIFEMKGNYAAALDNYTKALEKEPNNLPALQSTARLYMRQSQFESAVNFYNRVITVSPTAENYAELADAQQKSGRLNEAQASIQKAISLDPSVARYRNNLAGMLVSVGRSDEAVKQLEEVFPSAVANYNVAYMHFMNKNLAATQQHLQLALQADPNLQPARELMAKLGQNSTTQTAMSVFNTANQIYRTAQATSTAQLQAAPVQYSQQPGTNVGMPSSSMPNAVQQPGTISPVGQPTQPFNQSLPSLPDLPTVPSQY
jgi:Tfp pilus assembly protein PilF